jgi:hypothetical protein
MAPTHARTARRHEERNCKNLDVASAYAGGILIEDATFFTNLLHSKI